MRDVKQDFIELIVVAFKVIEVTYSLAMAASIVKKITFSFPKITFIVIRNYYCYFTNLEDN